MLPPRGRQQALRHVGEHMPRAQSPGRQSVQQLPDFEQAPPHEPAQRPLAQSPGRQVRQHPLPVEPQYPFGQLRPESYDATGMLRPRARGAGP